MTLDGGDDDPARLWAHLATAAERLGRGLGGQALVALGARGAAVETAVDELMNGLVAYGCPVTIVLDDLDAIGSQLSLGSIAHAIERLPTNARLVACTRSDPAISLARLRARGALREIRVRELAFTVDEVQELIERERIELSSESVELLLERTEGWPAGLYLAVLGSATRGSRRGRAVIRGQRSATRRLSDSRGSYGALPETRAFLVQPRCSVVSRRSCATRSSAARTQAALLAELARSNMFLVALDTPGVVSLSPSVRRASGARARARGRDRCCAGAQRRGVAHTG